MEDNNESFRLMSDKDKTSDVCMEAVGRLAYNLQFVPEGLKTTGMCRNALNGFPSLGYGDYELLAYIPFPDVCLEGIKEFEENVDIVDIVRVLRKEVINDEIADYVVGRNGRTLGLIPLHLQTEQLVQKAVEVSGNFALGYTTIRDDLKTENMYRIGLPNGFQNFLLIPERCRTPMLCLMAEKMYPDLFQKRPEILPHSITKSLNEYTLNKYLEKITGEKFSADQVEKFYHGQELKVKNIQTAHGLMKNQVVNFNKDERTISCIPFKQEKLKGLKM